MAGDWDNGVFALIGTLVGVGLKTGTSRTLSQRRANGKVVAQVQKARLIVEEINYAFYIENKKAPEKAIYEKLNSSAYEETDGFKANQKRVWDTIEKGEGGGRR